MVVCSVSLEQKWNDSLSSSGIVGKFLLVVAMFSQSPHCHLIEAGYGEDCGYKEIRRVFRGYCVMWRRLRFTWQTLCHEAERGPWIPLVGIIGTRNIVEQEGEWIFCWHRDFPLGTSWWTQISKRNMYGIVAIFIKLIKQQSWLGKEGSECITPTRNEMSPM